MDALLAATEPDPLGPAPTRAPAAEEARGRTCAIGTGDLPLAVPTRALRPAARAMIQKSPDLRRRDFLTTPASGGLEIFPGTGFSS